MSERAAKPETSESIVQHPRLTVSGGKSYIIGVSALGIVIGVLAGFSQTPIREYHLAVIIWTHYALAGR